MIVVTGIKKARLSLARARKKGRSIGFVPTMGALHQGHLSLIRRARRECKYVVVSVFVNPAQFGRAEDFSRYPKNFKQDRKLLNKEKVDMVFYPSAKAVYPEDFSTHVEETDLSRHLCGKSRPGHFKGVCTVVAKLFNIVSADIVYFGQKDYQQAKIIQRMTEDLNFGLRIKVLPIVRDRDGLAVSSRNRYLNAAQRRDALSIRAALRSAKRLISQGQRSSRQIISKMRKVISAHKHTRIDYIEIVDADTLQGLNLIKGKILVALAVYVGRARLIDNEVINVKK